MNDIKILVTGIGSAGVGEQILKSLKLSKLNISVIGTDVHADCFNKDLSDFFEIVPYANHASYISEMMKIVDKYDVKVIFPGSEFELEVLTQNKEKFKDAFIISNDLELIEICRNKYLTYRALEKQGFKLPRFYKINTVQDCESVDVYPVVLKPNTGSGGSSHIYVSYTKEELLFFTEYMLNRNIDIIAQEYIPYNDNEFTIGVSYDNHGKYLGNIILKRFLTSSISINKKMNFLDKPVIISSGISQGEFIHDDLLANQAIKISSALNPKAPINLQGRVVNGAFLLMEINPRLSGTTYLRALVGYNEPEFIIRKLLLNESVEYVYENGVVLRSLLEKRMR